MERQVKERLVGAAVLMAAAIILIPEMLSGRDGPHGPTSERATAEATFTTYTIDLQQPRANASSRAIVERSPPPQTAAAPPASVAAPAPPGEAVQANTESPVQTPSNDSLGSSVQGTAQEPQPPVVDEKPTDPARLRSASERSASERSASEAPERPAATANAPQVSAGGWVVQLGSFSKQATADRLAAEVRAAGRSAFVMPVRSGAVTLYRVRVGPMQERARAEAALNALKAKAPGAAIVAHP
ncbi:MAG TPA: SPOR domain-containing protein [Steroidobacter sp.]|nr:SPOR domain-containing protein [Steroidobacter sp.]